MQKKNEKEEGDNILREQLEFYKKNDVKIHITKTNSMCYGGKILELAGDLLILDDIKLGTMPIHFIEIKVLEKFKEK